MLLLPAFGRNGEVDLFQWNDSETQPVVVVVVTIVVLLVVVDDDVVVYLYLCWYSLILIKITNEIK